MNKIIERIAMKLEPGYFPQEDDSEFCWCVNCREARKNGQEYARTKARMVMEELLELTDAMIEAAEPWAEQNGFERGWRAAINEALK
jgi:hypothetical protein